MGRLSVAIITFNEELHIKNAIESVKGISDQIVVVDSLSTDRTEEICKGFKVDFYSQKWLGFSKQKQLAVDHCTNEWVLVLDADEVVSKECAIEIQQSIENHKFDGFEVPRVLHFMGKFLFYGKGVDYPLRLFKKKQGKFDGREIHEKVVLPGEVGRLKNYIFHYSSETILERLKKIKRDSEMEFLNYRPSGSVVRLLTLPWRYYFFNMIKRKGYKDGWRGIILNMLFSYQIFVQEYKYLFSRGAK